MKIRDVGQITMPNPQKLSINFSSNPSVSLVLDIELSCEVLCVTNDCKFGKLLFLMVRLYANSPLNLLIL